MVLAHHLHSSAAFDPAFFLLPLEKILYQQHPSSFNFLKEKQAKINLILNIT